MKVTIDEVKQTLRSSQSFTLKPGRWKYLFFLIFALLLSIGFLIGFVNTRDLGLLLAGLFFGLCATLFLLTSIPNASYLRLTKNGFEVRSLFRGRQYSWSEIHEFGGMIIPGGRYVGLNRQPNYPKQRLFRQFNRIFFKFEEMLPDTYGMKYTALADLLNECKNEFSDSKLSKK